MTDLDIPALKLLCEAATPNLDAYSPEQEERNKSFYFAARTALPKLIKEVEFHRTFLLKCNERVIPGVSDTADEAVSRLIEMRQENQSLKAEAERLQDDNKVWKSEASRTVIENQSLREENDRHKIIQVEATRINKELLKQHDEMRELLREARDWMAVGANVRGNRVSLIKRINAAIKDGVKKWNKR